MDSEQIIYLTILKKLSLKLIKRVNSQNVALFVIYKFSSGKKNKAHKSLNNSTIEAHHKLNSNDLKNAT